jgi:hypothetical protein
VCSRQHGLLVSTENVGTTQVAMQAAETSSPTGTVSLFLGVSKGNNEKGLSLRAATIFFCCRFVFLLPFRLFIPRSSSTVFPSAGQATACQRR